MQLGFSCIFISTHTSRVGCDAENISKKEDMEFLLTHPVWDVTAVTIQYSYLAKISTHTSRVGCDSAGIPLGSPGYIFLLTHPVWDVTSRLPLLRQRLLISTHTSRVGCDFFHFQSHPRGRFLLTHPVWDVTYLLRSCPIH